MPKHKPKFQCHLSNRQKTPCFFLILSPEFLQLASQCVGLTEPLGSTNLAPTSKGKGALVST